VSAVYQTDGSLDDEGRLRIVGTKWLTAGPVPAEMGRTIPTSVPYTEFIAALAPLVELLGLSLNEILADGFSVTTATAGPDGVAGTVRLYATMPVIGVDPTPSPERDDDRAAVWTWPVEVEAVL
jgi:hypothetical protein